MSVTVNTIISGGTGERFLGSTTWENRPTTAQVGDTIRATNIGPGFGSILTWDGTSWASNYEQILTASNVASADHTGTTSRTAIISTTIPGNLLGPNGSLIFRFRSTGSGAGAKLWNLTLNTTDLFHAGPTGQTWQGGRCEIINRNSNSSQYGNPLNGSVPDFTGVNTPLTGTVDTTVDQTLTLNATLSSALDIMTLQAWSVSFIARS